jgi:hypothetical protein
MTRYQKNSSPKNLSIREMWNLFQYLRLGLSNNPDEYMIDEISNLMGRIDTESFKQSLKIMYGDDVNYLEKTPIELALMFIQGIKHTSLFAFAEFVQVTSGSSR